MFLCPECKIKLDKLEDKIVCTKCSQIYGYLNDEIVVFNDAVDKVGFFDVQVTTRLSKMYADYSYPEFKECLKKRELFEMDLPNKKVGIAKKFWWEDYIGKIQDQSILEVGCGVNYMVPYWLDCNNVVTAFDVCKESVLLLRENLKKINLYNDNIDLFVGDVESIVFNGQFDIININNVLHHVKHKERALNFLRKSLKDNGRLLIVEPNYYYPFRWIIETDLLDRFNFVKSYFVKNNLIEKGEKGIVFRNLKKIVQKVGFRIEENISDYNCLGYAITHFIDNNHFLPKLIFMFDKYFFKYLFPSSLVPFEYLILRKR